MIFEFKDIKFKEENNKIIGSFLKNYTFIIEKTELKKIGKYKITKNQGIEIDNKFSKKFEKIIDKSFSNLTNRITNRKTIYIHQNSEIALIGSNYFGMIDRNTNLIEIRPNTGCNLNCIYCSVNEGNKKKSVDYVVEKDYLVNEIKKLILTKNCEDIEIHIGPQGEPLLYAPLVDLIADLSKISEIKRISIDTNAILLNEKKIDELINAGLTQFNISINSIDSELSKRISDNKNYSIAHIKEVLKIISKKDIKLLIAPVYLPTLNDSEIDKLIKLAIELNCKIGLQNYLEYKRGKRPIKKPITMDKFYKYLLELEKKFKIKLIFKEEDFYIKKTNSLSCPFRKGEILKIKLHHNWIRGRDKDEIITTVKERAVQIKGINSTISKSIKIKIIRIKHNIIHALKV